MAFARTLCLSTSTLDIVGLMILVIGLLRSTSVGGKSSLSRGTLAARYRPGSMRGKDDEMLLGLF